MTSLALVSSSRPQVMDPEMFFRPKCNAHPGTSMLLAEVLGNLAFCVEIALKVLISDLYFQQLFKLGPHLLMVRWASTCRPSSSKVAAPSCFEIKLHAASGMCNCCLRQVLYCQGKHRTADGLNFVYCTCPVTTPKPLTVTSKGLNTQFCCCRDLKPKHLVCLGGFKNLRQDYNYKGLKMELDETSYEWGTCYEIEIETVSCNTTQFASKYPPSGAGVSQRSQL